MTDREYWDRLDKEAEEFDAQFHRDKYMSVDEHDYIMNKTLNQVGKFTTLEELKTLNNQYKDIVFNLKDKQDKMHHLMKRHMNFTNEVMVLYRDMRNEVANANKYMHHAQDCYYLSKTASGRRVQVDETTDCSCGYVGHKRRLQIMEEADITYQKMMDDLDKLRKDYLSQYG